MAKKDISISTPSPKRKTGMWGWAAVILCVGFILWLIIYSVGNLIAKHYGGKVYATVNWLPKDCSGRRRNGVPMKVKVEEGTYSLRMSREDCRTGKYRLGQSVEVIWHRQLDIVIWPEGRIPENELIVSIGIAAGMFFIGWSAYRRHHRGLREKEEARLRNRRKPKRPDSGR